MSAKRAEPILIDREEAAKVAEAEETRMGSIPQRTEYANGRLEAAAEITFALRALPPYTTAQSLLSSEVALKIARVIRDRNFGYYNTREGLAELESIINKHFVAVATPAPAQLEPLPIDAIKAAVELSERINSPLHGALPTRHEIQNIIDRYRTQSAQPDVQTCVKCKEVIADENPNEIMAHENDSSNTK